jgi:Animal haem peroxidase
LGKSAFIDAPPPMTFERLLMPVGVLLDKVVGWDKLPRLLGIVALIGLREQLREKNLIDTGLVRAARHRPADLNKRTLGGAWNDITHPAMGSLRTRFGRNVPLDRAYGEPDPGRIGPSPREISCKLLARREFIPAETVNVLAAAWIQFEVHDWVSHDVYRDGDPDPAHRLEVAPAPGWPTQPMVVPRTRPDRIAAEPGSPPVFATRDTHWWDASQLYGSNRRFNETARTGSEGKLKIGPDGLHPVDLDELLDPKGPRGNFWVGLALLHALFIREHNKICDALLAAEGRRWSDDALHDRARLINAAVMAKIHSVEWTPAMIAHPTTEKASQVNWYGLLGKTFRERVGRVGRGDILSGIRGSPTDHHGVPYSLTEEFVTIYRMHPLIRDDYDFWSLRGGPAERFTFREIGPREWRERLPRLGIANAFYSLGIANPGAIVLHNYPNLLREGFVPDEGGPFVDLATVDILRDRERGVPRYNEFRTLLHRPPVNSFYELTKDEALAFELEEIYGDVERVDTMVGLYAEPRPQGFAFSETTFRLFLLMASRRLKSDRFFSTDYTRDVYTRTGLKWIDDATMTKVLLRHHPELAPVIRHDNAFKPWGAP